MAWLAKRCRQVESTDYCPTSPLHLTKAWVGFVRDQFTSSCSCSLFVYAVLCADLSIEQCVFLYSDINECAAVPRVCSHFCENLFGSFRCSCPVGHNLTSDNKTCEGESLWRVAWHLFCDTHVTCERIKPWSNNLNICWVMLRPCRVKRLQHFENKRIVEKMLRQRGCQTASISALNKCWPFNRGLTNALVHVLQISHVSFRKTCTRTRFPLYFVKAPILSFSRLNLIFDKIIY